MRTKVRRLRILAFFLGLAGVLCLCCACNGQADPGTIDHPTAQPESEIESAPGNSGSAAYTVTEMEGEEDLDFIIDFPAGKDLTVLQITDTQMQTMAGVRNETRRIQVGNAFFSSLPDDFEFRLWRYMDEAVQKAAPDLIVLTGDNIYGELDDSGEMWLALIQKMDSYGIPWCVVFGNHDNESGKGVQWQVEQLLASQYCIFRQGTVSGNSNYNLLVRQGGTAKFLFYMLDTNGCSTKPNNPGEGMMPDNVDIDKIHQSAGLRTDQISWMARTAKSIRGEHGEVPVLIFYHIPTNDLAQTIQKNYPTTGNTLPFVPDLKGDFGMAKERAGGVANSRFWRSAKEIGCTGMFVGHQHEIALSMMCDGIRITYGLKTGTYDYHDRKLLGSTKITLAESGGEFAVEYQYSELTYK